MAVEHLIRTVARRSFHLTGGPWSAGFKASWPDDGEAPNSFACSRSLWSDERRAASHRCTTHSTAPWSL